MDGILDMILKDLQRALNNRMKPDPNNVFGDVGGKAGNENLNMALSMLQNAGTDRGVYGMLPDNVQGGVMAPINRGLSAGADLALATMLGGYGGLQKAAGYGAEIIAGPTSSEERLARDLQGMIDVAGILPEGKILNAMRSNSPGIFDALRRQSGVRKVRRPGSFRRFQ